jgi:hypothetical protein
MKMRTAIAAKQATHEMKTTGFRYSRISTPTMPNRRVDSKTKQRKVAMTKAMMVRIKRAPFG